MINLFKLAAALGFAALATAALASPSTEAVSTEGRWLAQKLDAMGVDTKWIAGQRIDWRTGIPNGLPEVHAGLHTHCSAFVAAAAQSLGVYILRPPEHPQKLLANAQYRWLAKDGTAQGWRTLPDGQAAQAAANAGELVVAVYLSHRADKSGHIAIVKPSPRGSAEIEAEGPLVIQAGSVNSAAISLRQGFSGHPAAWRNREVVFYAHAIAAADQP